MFIFQKFCLKTKVSQVNNMKSITIYHNNRKIILWERTPEPEDLIEGFEIDESIIHKCKDGMGTILNTFLKMKKLRK